MTTPTIGASASAGYTSAGSGANSTVTPGITTVAGGALRVWAVIDGGASGGITLTDSRSNTWVEDYSVAIPSSPYPPGGTLKLYRATTSNRGASHTFTISATDGYATLFAADIQPGAGGETVTVDIAFATGQDSATPYVRAGTTGQADALVISIFNADTNSSFSGSASGFTNVANVSGSSQWSLMAARLNQASAGAVSASWSGTGIDNPTSPQTVGLMSFYGAGASGVTCTLAVTDTADTVSSAATLAVVATLSRTDAADTLSAGATAPVTVALSRTDAADTVSAAAGVAIVATHARTDTADTLSSAAAGLVLAVHGVTDAADTVSSTAFVGSAPVDCALAVTDTADSVASATTVAVSATVARTDAADTVSSAAAARVATALSVLDADDAFASAAVVRLLASLAVTDAADLLSAQTSSASELFVNLAVTDVPDVMAAALATAPTVYGSLVGRAREVLSGRNNTQTATRSNSQSSRR